MATIAQQSLFSWQKIEELGDLERLQLLLDNIPDEPLMRALESRRGNGRNDYPIRPLWNIILAGIVFQHASVEALRRELQRNGQLRQICGLDIFKGFAAVPPAYVFSRFFPLLFSCEKEVQQVFDDLVTKMSELLPDFGKTLAIDGKAIESLGNARSENADNSRDGRRDIDANWGVKTDKGLLEDGSTWSKTKSFLGTSFTLFLMQLMSCL